VLDIGLPEMSGYELAAHLREQPGGRSIHFIAATGLRSQPRSRQRRWPRASTTTWSSP
jgi:CheY-like chemotaxis protein